MDAKVEAKAADSCLARPRHPRRCNPSPPGCTSSPGRRAQGVNDGLTDRPGMRAFDDCSSNARRTLDEPTCDQLPARSPAPPFAWVRPRAKEVRGTGPSGLL